MTDKLLQELNNDAWLPFSQAFADGDVERYLELYAPDFTWIQAQRRIIMGFDEYAPLTRKSFVDRAARGVSVQIAFRFVERIASGELASERGVFQLSGSAPDGPRPQIYGRFHTVARRTGEGWRFVVDYESDDGGTVTAADFEAALPLDDVTGFEPG